MGVKTERHFIVATSENVRLFMRIKGIDFILVWNVLCHNETDFDKLGELDCYSVFLYSLVCFQYLFVAWSCRNNDKLKTRTEY